MEKQQPRAFPLFIPNDGGKVNPGMSLRAYFAGQAMQGLLSNPLIKRPQGNPQQIEKEEIQFAKTCLSYADALLAELSKPSNI